MKIQKVIHSCNSNKLYLDFWPVVAKLWKVYFGIDPILLYINDDPLTTSPPDTYGSVITLQPLNNIPVSLQALWARYWYPINEPETVFMISDIDMLPLSKYYFIDSIAAYSDDSYLHLNPCIESYGLIPSCYHLAKGSVFRNTLDIPDNFEDSIQEVYNFDSTNINTGWFNDEKYATHKLLSKIQSGANYIHLIPRPDNQYKKRIDRSNWSYDANLVKQEYYLDAHCVRPYQQYKTSIDSLSKLLLDQV